MYLPLLSVAYVLSEFATSNVPLEALWRPLLFALAAAITVQFALSALLMNRDRGAFVGLILLFLLIGLPPVSLVLTGWLAIAALVALRRPRRLGSMPWLRATKVLNAVACAAFAIVVVNGAFDGAFGWSNSKWDVPRGGAMTDVPDVYLIMLDGYPRSDTLTNEFAFDNSPFLDSMASLGFEEAAESRSNYDATVFTLASMMNGAQIPTLMPNPPAGTTAQFRAVSRLISNGVRLRDFRIAGYEIVTIPSGYYEGALTSADRFIDSGELSTFEMQLLTRGGLPQLFAGVERTWLPDQHRSRIRHAFSALGDLAGERGGTPKLVFAHLLTPHMPIAFTKDGGSAEPLPCFPATCSLFDYGDSYGAASGVQMTDQISWVNSAVERTVRTIQARSERPPVIVIFSDHGLRNDPADKDEMFRSLFLAATPGKSDVFPPDMTPVNLLTDLLNAYVGTDLALSTDESYWLETRAVDERGIFQFEPWSAPRTSTAR